VVLDPQIWLDSLLLRRSCLFMSSLDPIPRLFSTHTIQTFSPKRLFEKASCTPCSRMTIASFVGLPGPFLLTFDVSFTSSCAYCPFCPTLFRMSISVFCFLSLSASSKFIHFFHPNARPLLPSIPLFSAPHPDQVDQTGSSHPGTGDRNCRGGPDYSWTGSSLDWPPPHTIRPTTVSQGLEDRFHRPSTLCL